jgi:hypothetical protein
MRGKQSQFVTELFKIIYINMDFLKEWVRKRVIVSKVKSAKRLSWCREKRRSKVVGKWDRVIFSDERQVVIGSDNRVLK